MAKTPKEVLRVSDFLILDALRHRPMSIRELSLSTSVSQPTVRKRVDRFIEHKLVIPVKGNKYAASMVLWVAPAEDVAEVVTGEKVVYKPPSVPDLINEAGDAPKNAQEGPQEAHSEVSVSVPNLVPTPDPPKVYKPPKPSVKVSPGADKLAKRMRIPAHLYNRGEVSMGQVKKCLLCSKTTPIRYGEDTICPNCARGGK